MSVNGVSFDLLKNYMNIIFKCNETGDEVMVMSSGQGLSFLPLV